MFSGLLKTPLIGEAYLDLVSSLVVSRDREIAPLFSANSKQEFQALVFTKGGVTDVGSEKHGKTYKTS